MINLLYKEINHYQKIFHKMEVNSSNNKINLKKKVSPSKIQFKFQMNKNTMKDNYYKMVKVWNNLMINKKIFRYKIKIKKLMQMIR